MAKKSIKGQMLFLKSFEVFFAVVLNLTSASISTKAKSNGRSLERIRGGLRRVCSGPRRLLVKI